MKTNPDNEGVCVPTAAIPPSEREWVGKIHDDDYYVVPIVALGTCARLEQATWFYSHPFNSFIDCMSCADGVVGCEAGGGAFFTDRTSTRNEAEILAKHDYARLEKNGYFSHRLNN